MNEEDKKYLKYLSKGTLGIIQEALEIALNEVSYLNTPQALNDLYNEVNRIMEEKVASEGNIMEMDFAQFKKNLRFKSEVKKATEASTEENLNVWDFLLNIRQYIKEAKSITMQSQFSAYDKVYNYRFNMENGEDCILIVQIPHTTEYKLGIGDVFTLIKNPDTKWVSGSILLKELREDNPLNLKEEDLDTFIQYLDELCDTRRV